MFEMALGFLFLLWGLAIAILPFVNSYRLKNLEAEISALRLQLQPHMSWRSQPGQSAGIFQSPYEGGHKGAHTDRDDVDKGGVSTLPDSSAPIRQVRNGKSAGKVKSPSTDKVKTSLQSLPAQKSGPVQTLPKSMKGSGYGMELNFSAGLPVWVGAVSLIFAAFFMVKYSIENNFLGPSVRVTLGGFFGLSMLLVGHCLAKYPKIANATRIAQGLVGAGIVSLYVSLYAATNLYGLIRAEACFSGMVAVTAIAVVLSLRHGQPIAVFGVVGGLMTPGLVGADQPDAVMLFGYLFLLFAGLINVLARRGWWLLSLFALLGVFVWVHLWFFLAFSPHDVFILDLFLLGVMVVVLAATTRSVASEQKPPSQSSNHRVVFADQPWSRPQHTINMGTMAAIVLTMFMLQSKISLGMFDWSVLGLIGVAMMVLTYFRPDIYRTALLAVVAVTFVLLCVWAGDADGHSLLLVLSGLGGVYVVGAGILLRKQVDPHFMSVVQVVVALALYLIGFWFLDVPAWAADSSDMFWGAVGMALSGLLLMAGQAFSHGCCWRYMRCY